MPLYMRAHSVFDDDGVLETEDDAFSSSPGPHSDPFLPFIPPDFNTSHLAFNDIPFDTQTSCSEDSDIRDIDWREVDEDFRQSARSDEEKALSVLDFIRDSFRSHFSLARFITTVLSSKDHRISKWSRGMNGEKGMEVLRLLAAFIGPKDPLLTHWLVQQAAEICRDSIDNLTSLASKGDHYETAKSLRIRPADVTVDFTQDVSLSALRRQYDDSLPELQTFIKAVIGKECDGEAEDLGGATGGMDSSDTTTAARSPVEARTLLTSLMLYQRSRLSNKHQVILSLLMWDNRVPRRLMQLLNRLGLTMSYKYTMKAVGCLSKDSVRRAQLAAADMTKLKLLIYDNFNWRNRAWEASATHGHVQHDQVSALLVIIPNDDNGTAEHLANASRFADKEGTRLKMDATQALEDILPSKSDQLIFVHHSVLHVAQILADEIKGFSQFAIAAFDDPHALLLRITEEYFMPTFDQEQGSTRGNMIVLEHYFIRVLKIPKLVFDRIMFFVLGDRLTTVRDRAAQAQRAVDRSDASVDRLASFRMLNGLMHTSMNMEENIAKNSWGEGIDEPTSIQTILKLPGLENLKDLNLRKLDHYAWLRFLDTLLRSLVIASAVALSKCTSVEELRAKPFTQETFDVLCNNIVLTTVVPSIDALEANSIKTLPGETVCGHAVLLMHHLMSLREMRHAIKLGHPSRVLRIIKFWTPMFYAGARYNYAHEMMELLHNCIHDWPEDSARVLFGGMILNGKGYRDSHKESDLRNEHLNDCIKEHAHGPNATPKFLEKITPALGHLQTLSDRLYDILGVEKQNQRHKKVSQSKEISIIATYFVTKHVFCFADDQPSKTTMVDLFRTGIQRLAGEKGGHFQHLQQYRLRTRQRNVGHGDGATHSDDPELASAPQFPLSRDGEPLLYSLAFASEMEGYDYDEPSDMPVLNPEDDDDDELPENVVI